MKSFFKFTNNSNIKSCINKTFTTNSLRNNEIIKKTAFEETQVFKNDNYSKLNSFNLKTTENLKKEGIKEENKKEEVKVKKEELIPILKKIRLGMNASSFYINLLKKTIKKYSNYFKNESKNLASNPIQFMISEFKYLKNSLSIIKHLRNNFNSYDKSMHHFSFVNSITNNSLYGLILFYFLNLGLGGSASIGIFTCAPQLIFLSALFNSGVRLGNKAYILDKAKYNFETPFPINAIHELKLRSFYSFLSLFTAIILPGVPTFLASLAVCYYHAIKINNISTEAICMPAFYEFAKIKFDPYQDNIDTNLKPFHNMGNTIFKEKLNRSKEEIKARVLNSKSSSKEMKEILEQKDYDFLLQNNISIVYRAYMFTIGNFYRKSLIYQLLIILTLIAFNFCEFRDSLNQGKYLDEAVELLNNQDDTKFLEKIAEIESKLNRI